MTKTTSGQANGPVEFARDVLGVKLTALQKQLLRALLAHRRIAVKSCHASGKTFVMAICALWWATAHDDSAVLVVSPGWLQTRSVLFGTIHALLAGARKQLPFTVSNQTELRYGTGAFILGLSSNDATRLQGFHARNVLVLVDEAVGLDPSFYPALEGALTSTNARMWLSGNPTKQGGPFHDAFARNHKLWKTFTISAFDTPNLKGVSIEQLLALDDAALDDNQWPELVTRRWVRDRYLEWFNGSASASPLWQSRVLGEFPESASDALIPWSALQAARRPAQPDPRAPIVTGVDVSGAGKDRTACFSVQGGAIVNRAVFLSALPFVEVLDYLGRSRTSRAQVDSAGLGYEWPSRMRAAGYRAEGVNVGTSPDEKYADRFANRKAQRYWALRSAFLLDAVSGLDEETASELAALSYGINASGKIAIDDKATVKSAIGRSPDLAEALMLSSLGDAVWLQQAAGPRPAFTYTTMPRADSLNAVISRALARGRSTTPHPPDTAAHAEALEDRGEMRSGRRRGRVWLTL